MPSDLERARSIEAMKRRAFALIARYGFDREERCEFASKLLDREINSWNELRPQEWWRLVDGLEGAAWVFHLFAQRKGSRGR